MNYNTDKEHAAPKCVSLRNDYIKGCSPDIMPMYLGPPRQLSNEEGKMAKRNMGRK
jgi:hypothetical protein